MSAVSASRPVAGIGRDGFPFSALVWLGLIAYVALAKTLLDAFLPHAFASEEQRDVFSWPVIGVLGSAGLVGVWLAHRSGFPAAWSAGASVRRRLLVPGAVGLAIGAWYVAYDLVTGASTALNAAHGITQQYTDFPSMFLIFTAAAVFVEPIYRLLLIPLPLWLVSTVLLRGRWQEPLFWAFAVAASLFEPLDQARAVTGLAPALWWAQVAQGFGVNLTQAFFFRREGFLASIAVRLAFYVVWHVLYVH
jgi:hypothetical protein